MPTALCHCRRRIARGLIVPIGLALALPDPALALREPQEDHTVPELAAALTAGLEEGERRTLHVPQNSSRPRVSDRQDLPDIVMGEFTVITRGQVKTWGASTCVICAIYQPGHAGPALLAHIDPVALKHPTSYRRMITEAHRRGIDLANVRVELIGMGDPIGWRGSQADRAMIRTELQRACSRVAGISLSDDKQMVEDVVPFAYDGRSIVLDADRGALYDLQDALVEGPIYDAGMARQKRYGTKVHSGARPPLRYMDVQRPAALGLRTTLALQPGRQIAFPPPALMVQDTEAGQTLDAFLASRGHEPSPAHSTVNHYHIARFLQPLLRLEAGDEVRILPALAAALTAGLEEDDDFIFELARSDKPLTVDDVSRVNAWVFLQDGAGPKKHGWLDHEQYLEQLLAWVADVQRSEPIALDRYPELTTELERSARWRLDLQDPVTVAAATHWLFPRVEDGSHRTAWLIMNILLSRAGYPMIARHPGGRSDEYYDAFGGDLADDPQPFVKQIRELVEQTPPADLAAARVTDLTVAPTPYRMLVERPAGVDLPMELFITAGPVRIVSQGKVADRAIRQLLSDAAERESGLGLTSEMVSLEPWRPGMTLNDPALHTILVRSADDLAVSDSTPTLRQRLAIVTLTPEMTTFADLLRRALAQWANRPLESIRPFQRLILRGRRAEFYA
ncbi:MAG: hypothetical protein HY600_00440 [Candidatus Omnitrophica bacterium]|nr:hypothetical protein [Candidatus Omnitrophota bacterium]